MKAFDFSQVKLKKTVTVDHSIPKVKADVEELSANHDQVFMSFNIEHWYPVLGPSKTSATKFYPITKTVAERILALHVSLTTEYRTRDAILADIGDDIVLSTVASELQILMDPEGCFMKTSARSCKDIALEIGLLDRYWKLLLNEITNHGKQIEDMRLRSLFMEAGRQVLRFKNAEDFLVACILSERICGDIERALRDDLKEPLSFVIRDWMPICPPEFVPLSLHVSDTQEFRCFVTNGRLNAISQYISTIYSRLLISLAPQIRLHLSDYFNNQIKSPLSTLYDRYAVDIVLLNPTEGEEEWKFWVIEVNPFFELTGEGLFESEEGRRILRGESEVEYPVMRVQEFRCVDGTEKSLSVARRNVERELGIISI